MKYKIVSEWDLGLNEENTVYDSKEAAIKDARQAVKDLDLVDQGDSFESLVEDGLITIKEVTVK